MGKIDLDKLITSLLSNKDENYRGYVVFRDIVKALEEQGLEYKHRGIKRKSSKPKFKVGDWIVNKLGRCAKISDVTPTSYSLKINSRIDSYTKKLVEDYHHLWTIKDAKLGDILADDDGWIGIFKELKKNEIDTFCLYTSEFGFATNGHNVSWDGLTPATRQQEITLFKSINEAGYRWDKEQLRLVALTEIEKKMVAKRLYLESKGIIWSEDEWKGYKEGLEDIYKNN